MDKRLLQWVRINFKDTYLDSRLTAYHSGNFFIYRACEEEGIDRLYTVMKNYRTIQTSKLAPRKEGASVEMAVV